MAIPFTQFLRPNGRKQSVTIDRPPEIEALARDVMRAGYRMEAEVLTTDEVSFEIVKDVPDPDIDDSLAIEICPNGPAVPDAVDRLILQAASELQLPKNPS